MKIGFIGLGIMGRPMAMHLIKAGHDLIVPERSSLTEEVRGAAQVVADPKAVAAESEILILMLPDTPDVETVLFAETGAAKSLREGVLVIDMSSISPIETKQFATRLKSQGVEYVDAPVSGGQVGAESATLTIMAGGSLSAFMRAKPLFDLMGKNVTHVGDVGSGQICKVANQIIVALNIQAVSEALVFASKAGADPHKVRQAISGGFAASRVLELHAERMLNGSFDPGFKIKLHQKDLGLALASAKALELGLPATAMAQQMMSSCVAHGGAELDHSAMILAIEGLANHSIRPEPVPGDN